jgi:hypothetical protein
MRVACDGMTGFPGSGNPRMLFIIRGLKGLTLFQPALEGISGYPSPFQFRLRRVFVRLHADKTFPLLRGESLILSK